MASTNNNQPANTIPALMFEMKMPKLALAFFRGMINTSGFWKPGGPIGIKQVPFPELVSEDWVIIKTVYCGICGSDMSEVTLSGAIDNPIQSFLSFPQIMGHEPVGIVDRVGSKVRRLKVGDRVAVSPWFPCKPRGIIPECPRCQQGEYTHCHNFQRGQLPTGMHLGVTTGFGGYSPYFSVHESQCFIIPEEVTFEQASVADPFSVAFHACIILDPKPDSTILVFGLGIIGLCTITCLKNLFGVEHVLAVGRYPFQKESAIKCGATYVFISRGEALLIEIAEYIDVEVYKPDKGMKWAHEGVDGIVDNIASAESLEIGMRIMDTQGRLVFPGVHKPERCENSLHYLKEMEIVGSNAFAIENYRGRHAHAFEFFLEFLAEKKIDTTPLVTHKVPLEQYQEAFNAMANKHESEAIKVLFDFTGG